MITIDQKTAQVIDELFISLQSICPAFKQAWPTQFEIDEAKYHWVQAFRDCGLNEMEKIHIGIRNFRRLKKSFVPTPGEFIDLCKPLASDYGLKDTETAFKEACEQSHPTASKIFSHSTIKLARDLTGTFFLCTRPRSQSFPVFEKNYDQCVDMFLKNRNLNQIEVDSAIKRQELKEPETINRFRHLRSHKSAIEVMREMLKGN
jgi:hypothetical protein